MSHTHNKRERHDAILLRLVNTTEYEGINPENLAQDLDCNPSTIYRDLNELAEIHPIEKTERGRYRLDRNKYISNIYAGAIKERWLKDYNDQAKLFRRDILNTITPFTSADISQRNAFYKMFDGIDVLPLDCMDDYYDTLETEGYLAASQYLVNISNVRYRILYGNGKVHKDEDENDPPQINVPYSEEYGLDFDG